MTKKRKICMIVLIAAAVIAAGLAIAYFCLSVTFDYNGPEIKAVSDRRVEVRTVNGRTTLVKLDAAGNVSDEPIKVIGFTDTHLDSKKEKGDVTFEFIVRNIMSEKPDLVIFDGDTITSGFNRLRMRQLCRTMEKLGVYWAPVLGNHEGDNIWSMSRRAMVRMMDSYDCCLMDSSVRYTADGEKVWGNGNYFIDLADSKGNIYRTLYFIDGGSAMSDEDMVRYDAEFDDKSHNDYDYVKASQIQWYEESVKEADRLNGAPVKSVIFDHIPLIEFRTAYEEITGETEAVTTGPDPGLYGVPNANGTCLIAGQRRETVCYSGHNSGLFDAMERLGSTDLMVCGHDHINDYIIEYRGITLAYNAPSGYSSYNVVSKGISDKLTNGYSRYFFKPDGSFTMEQIQNADLYPEMQEAIKKLY